jgi:hypothetical protein
MSDFFHSVVQMPAPFNMVVLIVLIVSAASVVKAVAKFGRQYACHRNEMEFKRDLVERGMTAAEVDQVVRSRGQTSKIDD